MGNIQWNLKEDSTIEAVVQRQEGGAGPQEEILHAVDCAVRGQGIWLAGRARCRAAGSGAILVQAGVLPSAALPEYCGLRAEYRAAPPAAGNVEAQLRALARANTSRTETGQPAREGDAVVLDYDIRLPDGTAFSGSRCRGVQFDLREPDSLLPELRQAVAGLRPGQRFACRAVLPAEYAVPGAAGRAVEIEGRVLRVFWQQQPALDDGLAKACGYESMERLRAALFEREAKRNELLGRKIAGRRLLDQLCAAAELDVPRLAVRLELEARQAQLAGRLRRSGITLEQHLKRLRKTAPQLEQELEAHTMQELHSRFALLAIARAEGLDAAEPELAAAAGAHGAARADRMQLRQRLCAQKAAKYVLDHTEFVRSSR